MNDLVSIEKERKKYKKNLHIGQTTAKPSFGPVFIDAAHFPVVLHEQDLYISELFS
jgi:hypothetical protein